MRPSSPPGIPFHPSSKECPAVNTASDGGVVSSAGLDHKCVSEDVVANGRACLRHRGGVNARRKRTLRRSALRSAEHVKEDGEVTASEKTRRRVVVRFRKCKAKWACRAGIRKVGIGNTDWILDSGANVVCVPEGDPAIVKLIEGHLTTVSTASGIVQARRARIRTPVGVHMGLVLDSPRLLPMWKIADGGRILWRGIRVTASHRGRQLPISVREGCPVLLDVGASGAAERRRLEHDGGPAGDLPTAAVRIVQGRSSVTPTVGDGEERRNTGGDVGVVKASALTKDLINPTFEGEPVSSRAEDEEVGSLVEGEHAEDIFDEFLSSLRPSVARKASTEVLARGASVALRVGVAAAVSYVSQVYGSVGHFADAPEEVRKRRADRHRARREKKRGVRFVIPLNDVEVVPDVPKALVLDDCPEWLGILRYAAAGKFMTAADVRSVRATGTGLDGVSGQASDQRLTDLSDSCVACCGSARGKSSDGLCAAFSTRCGHGDTWDVSSSGPNSVRRRGGDIESGYTAEGAQPGVGAGEDIKSGWHSIDASSASIPMTSSLFPTEDQTTWDAAEAHVHTAVADHATTSHLLGGPCRLRYKALSAIPMSHLIDHFPKRADCPHCQRGKAVYPPQYRYEHPKTDEPTGSKLFADLAGPWPTTHHGENTLLVVGTKQGHLRFSFPLAGKHANGVVRALTMVHHWLRGIREFGDETSELSAWVLSTDRGGEFEGKVIEEYLCRTGGVWTTVPKGRHQHNAESLIRQVSEAVRTTLSSAGLPGKFWGFAATSYCWNWNMKSVQFEKWASATGMLRHRFMFGQLCFVKTDNSENLVINKAAPRGRAAAFLGPTNDSRKSCWVLVLCENGKYAVTSVGWEGITFESPVVEKRAVDAEGNLLNHFESVKESSPVFAFNRRFEDLQMIAAPGETLRELGGGELAREPELVQPLHDVALEPLEANPDGRVIDSLNQLSRCPACRGRGNRGHTYRGEGANRCMFSGLDLPTLRQARNICGTGRGATELIIRAADYAREGHSWDDTKTWLRELVTATRLAREDGEEPALDEGADIAALASVMYLATSAAVNDESRLSQTSGAAKRRRWKSQAEKARTLRLPRACLAQGECKDETSEKVAKVRVRRIEEKPPYLKASTTASGVLDEIDNQMLTDADRLQAGHPSSELFDVDDETVYNIDFTASDLITHRMVVDGPEEDEAALRAQAHLAQHLPQSSRAWKERLLSRRLALMTRNLTSAEKSSAPAIAAMMEEAAKVEKKGTFGDPVRKGKADPKGTISRLHMLSYLKGAELQNEAERKYKGRLVCLGDRIWEVGSGLFRHLCGEDYGFDGEIASLGAFRLVCTHAAIHGHRLESADVKTAYLCATWPDSLPRHYFTIDEKLMSCFSKELQEKIWHLGGPQHVLIPMNRPLYGHPLAGFMWLETLGKFLEKEGWHVTDVPGHWRKQASDGSTMELVGYVDDLCVSGPEEDVAALWSSMQAPIDEGGAGLELSSVGPTDRFLGIRVRQLDNGIFIDVQEYIEDLAADFEKEFGRKLLSPKTPMSEELRAPPGSKTSAQESRVLKLIGRLLWVCRTCRPDIAFAASRLGTRVGTWDGECLDEATRTVGYLLRTADHGLTFSRPRQSHLGLEVGLHTDASWRKERSQTGGILCVEVVLEGGRREVIAVVDWLSKKQSIIADSSGASEMIAAHTAVRTLYSIAEDLSSQLGEKLVLWTDNSTVISAAKGRCKLDWLQAKPLRIRCGCLADMVALRMLRVGYCPTEEQLADGLTKSLERLKLESWCRGLGLGSFRDATSLAVGGGVALAFVAGSRHLRGR